MLSGILEAASKMEVLCPENQVPPARLQIELRKAIETSGFPSGATEIQEIANADGAAFHSFVNELTADVEWEQREQVLKKSLPALRLIVGAHISGDLHLRPCIGCMNWVRPEVAH